MPTYFNISLRTIGRLQCCCALGERSVKRTDRRWVRANTFSVSRAV